MRLRMTQFLCLGALLLLSLMQLTQAVATPNNNNNNNNAKPKPIAQVQPASPAGKKPAIVATTLKPQRLVQDPKCLQPLETGPCRMNLERFYYNKDTKTCETFKYGGCRGNDNRWGFRQTCEEACLPKNK
ncbi:kunitz-type serine protease inhibitor bungaruskunin [Drosophila eugracilis]|uniref:kunitz-type serine protease inhibitor bungaruskunin n=1 Tax=Drosophila eugracilis TaxID=29029 RepID=UPI001BD9B4A3|nr:kunitz-type serine protease inhibitor bungaruskunin [Drosophila eugracilis]